VSTGSLTLVATPIGNLGDITQRAIDALTAADIVCCEDTRRTGMLLSHLGISGKKYVVVNEHTEHDACDEIVAAIVAGRNVALVSDAGTPGISDPGERVVRAALAANIPVTSAPGVAALTMALVLSGMPTARFVFEGFLPRSGGERAARLAAIADEPRTIVLYEAPHRIERTLADLEVACSAMRNVALARELTKMHEDVWRGTLHDAVRHANDVAPRGEYVIVIEGARPPAPATDDEIIQALRHEMAAGASKRDAAARVAAKLGAAKRRVYELALQLQ
jgi:16S rRNA (cytidine1402-2'-O)-methyltransferase